MLYGHFKVPMLGRTQQGVGCDIYPTGILIMLETSNFDGYPL